MASREYMEKGAKALFKRGVTTQKAHARHMEKIAAMFPAAAPASQGGAQPDPSMAAAVLPADAPALPVTVSVPGSSNSSGDPAKGLKPPGM